MAVKIRLARRGRKKLAIYDVVVADARAPRDGRFIEKIGSYNPNTDPASININNDRALKWLMNGAQPTDTVKAMLSYRGVMLKKHLQIGVVKGAITQEQADEKFQAWLDTKEQVIAGKVEKIQEARDSAKKAAFEAEAAKNQARIDAIKKREDDAIAAVKAEEAAAKAAAEPAPSPEATASTEEVPDTTPVEEKAAALEDKPAENKAAEEKAIEEKAPEEKPVENKAPEEKAPEEKPVENKAPEEKAPENKATEEKPAEDKASEEKPAEDSEKKD